MDRRGGSNGWQSPRPDGVPEPPPIADIRIADARRTHILDGEPGRSGGGHRYGTGRPGKTEFPQRWDDDTVTAHVLDVAKRPDAIEWRPRNSRWRVIGRRDDVDVVVIVDPDGGVRTSFPQRGGHGVVENPRRRGQRT